MFNIGEFSTISGIPVRTLRFYHEERLLVPAAVDAETGYRSYDERNLEVANVIVALRGLEFSLDEIREMLAGTGDDADILDHLEQQRDVDGRTAAALSKCGQADRRNHPTRARSAGGTKHGYVSL